MLRVRNVFQGWFRDAFSSGVLGTTSPEAPQGLSGGLSLGFRLALAITVMALAWLATWSIGPIGVLFLFPALMVAGACGMEIGIAALAAAIAGVAWRSR